MTLKVYAAPLRLLPVAEVSTPDVLKVLQPLWLKKPETAGFAAESRPCSMRPGAGHIDDRAPNPARWAGHLETLLPPPARLARGHHRAIMKRLSGQDSMAAMALRFLILTAARSGEVLGAVWNEIDLAAKVWTVPASRMKASRASIACRFPIRQPRSLRGLPRSGSGRSFFRDKSAGVRCRIWRSKCCFAG